MGLEVSGLDTCALHNVQVHSVGSYEGRVGGLMLVVLVCMCVCVYVCMCVCVYVCIWEYVYMKVE